MPWNSCTLKVCNIFPLFCSLSADIDSPEYIHRNLKTANLLLDEESHVKICGFGISRPAPTENDGNMTNELGSARWSAPEVLKNERYGKPADVFSFGILQASNSFISCNLTHFLASILQVSSFRSCSLRLCLNKGLHFLLCHGTSFQKEQQFPNTWFLPKVLPEEISGSSCWLVLYVYSHSECCTT